MSLYGRQVAGSRFFKAPYVQISQGTCHKKRATKRFNQIITKSCEVFLQKLRIFFFLAFQFGL